MEIKRNPHMEVRIQKRSQMNSGWNTGEDLKPRRDEQKVSVYSPLTTIRKWSRTIPTVEK